MPLTPTTEGIVGERELRALPRSAFVLNPSRGPLIQENALLQALTEGSVSGAAIDTHYHYPLPPEHPLWRFPNVILTPHISGSAQSPHFLDRTWEIYAWNIETTFQETRSALGLGDDARVVREDGPSRRPVPAGAVHGGRGAVPRAAGGEADRCGVVAGQGDGDVLRCPVRGPPVAVGRGRFATGRGRHGPEETPRPHPRTAAHHARPGRLSRWNRHQPSSDAFNHSPAQQLHSNGLEVWQTRSTAGPHARGEAPCESTSSRPSPCF